MSFLLPKLTNKTEVDEAIKSTEDIVLVLRFGRDDDKVCMQLDHIVSVKNINIMSFRDSTFSFNSMCFYK